MLYTNAVFKRKDTEIETKECVVDKVIRLSGAEYDRFSHGLMRDWDFIRDNPIDTVVDKEGRYHCLLVVSDDRRDGILVNPEGGDYARYSAFIPNVEGLLTVGQYPALASLNRSLTGIVDYIAEEICGGPFEERSVVDLQDLESMFDIDLMTNGALRRVVLDMLNERPEIKDWELDKNELIIHRAPEPPPPAEDLSDPSVTLTDMYAYGYGWDGMIPLGKERALELFDEGHTVFRLYQNDAEGMIDSREEIAEYDGLFGVENPAWAEREHPALIEVFVLNREQHEKGKVAGEWLALPADADTLRGLFERIGIDRPSEGAFTVTAVRVPNDNIRDYVTKYDNLDELNMLASFMDDMTDFERDKFQAILTSGVKYIGNGTADLINTLCEENFDAFRMIEATDYESLGRSSENEDLDKPDDISFEEHGRQIVADEGGKFTEHGYIYFRYKDLLPEYSGVVPDEYKIIGAALQGLRSKQAERSGDEKPSVVEKIRAARNTPRRPKERGAQKQNNDKGGPEL